MDLVLTQVTQRTRDLDPLRKFIISFAIQTSNHCSKPGHFAWSKAQYKISSAANKMILPQRHEAVTMWRLRLTAKKSSHISNQLINHPQVWLCFLVDLKIYGY